MTVQSASWWITAVRPGLAALSVMAVLDVAWILLNVRYGVYRGAVNIERPRWQVMLLWALVLVVLASAVVPLAVGCKPRSGRRFSTAALRGFAAGVIIYFVFNATALVAFGRQWTWYAAAADTAWGGALLTAGAVAAAAASQPA